MDIKNKIENEVEYSTHLRPEYDGPEGMFDSGNEEEDARICAQIRSDAEWNEWAWCTVEVRATWNGVFGNAFLGACSYASEKDFKEDGYYNDMKNQALESLCAKLEKLQIREE